MPKIKLVKRYPHIKDEDVSNIFQEGYIKGFENGRKKMRLVDADKITFFDCLAKTGNSVCCHAKGIVSKEGIDAQPTVEAIPIEWIHKWINDKYTRSSISAADYWAIIRMIITWEKGNTPSTCAGCIKE